MICLRLGFFLLGLSLFGLLEHFYPRRPLKHSKIKRWLTNLSMVAIGSLLIRLLGLLLPVSFAQMVEKYQWGLLHHYPLPYWLACFLTVILLDMAVYFQHRLFHAVPLLWRFHRVHHLDLDLDVSSGNRFHPVELLLSNYVKLIVILLLGPPATGVLVFELVLNISAQFNHANLHLPKAIDSLIRRWLVTPDMHTVHHSMKRQETNSNFGFCLSVWDKLFKTYQAKPGKGCIHVDIGIEKIRAFNDTLFYRALKNPLD